jgi:hypothetical protein
MREGGEDQKWQGRTQSGCTETAVEADTAGAARTTARTAKAAAKTLLNCFFMVAPREFGRKIHPGQSIRAPRKGNNRGIARYPYLFAVRDRFIPYAGRVDLVPTRHKGSP